MSSLVSEFIINPVLRQARRFSEISRSTLAGDGEELSCQQQNYAVVDSDTVESSAPLPAPVSDANTQPRPRSSNSCTHEGQEVGFEEPVMRMDMSASETPQDHLRFPLSPRRNRAIPEDDGMHGLRCRIQAINGQDIPSSEKARLMHEALVEGYRASQIARHVQTLKTDDKSPQSPAWESSSPPTGADSFKTWSSPFGEDTNPEEFELNDMDIVPTYAPIRHRKSFSDQATLDMPSTPPDTDPPLGCQHYERNVKLQCFTCKRWYTCRFCHDANEDHNLIRTETKNMLCMLCATPQQASDACINCGQIAAQYYCSVCKLWENRNSKPIYHCNDCGICRRGLGLGKDFFHCKTCKACITTSIRSSHKCIERSTDCDCPICGEYMFTSPRPVVFMTCGHSIHKKCYDQHMKVSYKCPICSRSLANMETQFRNLDAFIEGQPMPSEFRDTKAVILCNDCSGRSTVAYHWLGLKCSICRSYNTVEIQILGGDSQELQNAMARRAAATAESSLEPGDPSAMRDGVLIPAVARSGNQLANRRRHSSHAAEPEHVLPDRIARSLSPTGMGEDSLLAQMVPDDDSENDMLGFWRSNGEDDGESSYESDSDSADGSVGGVEVEDADEEEDDDIMLIGHR